MKRNFAYMLIIIVLSLMSIFTLKFLKQDHGRSGFFRKIEKRKFSILKVLDLPSNNFFFAGSSQNEFYFKDLVNLNQVISIDHTLSVLNKINLNLPEIYTSWKRRISVSVIDSKIYFTDDNTGQLTTFKIKTSEYFKYKDPKIRINQTNIISNTKIIGKNTILNNDTLQRQLIKLDFTNGEIEQSYTFDYHSEGYFSSDGFLQSMPGDPRLFYMYFYRGSFLCLDSNLNIIYHAKTIDTVTTANIKIAKLTKNFKYGIQTTLTQSSPPKVVNRNYTIFDNRLFILSALKSDNEDDLDFERNQIIDAYNINNGSYVNSFYIPKYRGYKLREFRMIDNFAFAIYDRFFVKYSFKDK